MMKSKAIARTLIASAVLAVVGAAHANSVTVTARTVANEAFGTAVAQPTVAAGAISLPAMQYTFNTPGGIVVNPSGSVKVVFTLAGGTANTTGTFNATTNVTLSGGVNTLTPTVAVSGSTLTVTLTNGTGSNITIGIGATVTLTGTAADQQYRVIGVTKGTDVTVTGKALNGADDSVLEAATAAATAVTFAEAVTAAKADSTATVKINLNTTPTPGTALTTGTKVSFGGVKLTNATGTQVKLDNAGAADTDIVAATATAYAQSGTFVIGKASGSFTPGMTLGVFTDETCATAITGTAAAPVYSPASTVGIVATTATVTLAYTGLTAAQLLAGAYVCGDYSGVTAGTVFKEVTPTIAFTYDKFSTSYTDETVAAFNGYALATNGQTIDIKSYIPKAVSGYTSFVRVINTGTLSAVVTGQWLYEDGTTGTAAALGTALAAGGAKTYTSEEIEAALGAPTATIGNNRPRLRLTAPTSGMQAQSFFLNPDNSFSTMHSGD